MTVIISYICFLPFRKLPPGRHRSGKRLLDRTMVLIHSQSAASIGSSVSSDARRARPRKDPAARWVQPNTQLPSLPQPAGFGGGLNNTDAAVHMAKFVSQALLSDPAEALELAVSMAPSLIPGVQWAHFLSYSSSPLQQPLLTLICSGGGANEPAPLALPVSEGLIGWVARSGVPAVEADASLHLAYSRTHETALLGRSPVLCLPLGAGSLGVGSSVVGGSRGGAGTPSRSKSVTLPPQPELSSTVPPEVPSASAAAEEAAANPSPSPPRPSVEEMTAEAAEAGKAQGDTPAEVDVTDGASAAPKASAPPVTPPAATAAQAGGGDGAASNLAGVLVFTGRFGKTFGEAELQLAQAVADIVRARVGVADSGPSGRSWVDDVGYEVATDATSSANGRRPTSTSSYGSLCSRPGSVAAVGASSAAFSGASGPAGTSPLRALPRRKRATREQLEAEVQAAQAEIDRLHLQLSGAAEGHREQLAEAREQLLVAQSERDHMHTQVRTTQATHARLLGEHNALVAQHSRAEAQIRLLEGEVDALRNNETKLLPDLQRWLALTEQLASMLTAAKQISGGLATRLPQLSHALVGAGAGAAGEGGGGEGGEGEGATRSAAWASRELTPQLAKFDAALEAAIPNLVVAKPWLEQLMRPLQESLHKVVENAADWREPGAGEANGTDGVASGSPTAAPVNSRANSSSGSRVNTPQRPRAAGPNLRVGTGKSIAEPTALATGVGGGGGDLGALSVTRSSNRLSATPSLQKVSLDAAAPTGASTMSLSLAPGLPARPLPLGLPDPNRYAKVSASTITSAHATGPLQHALLGRPSPLAKLAPNSFLPGGAREVLAQGSFGEQHFLHASRVSHVAEA